MLIRKFKVQSKKRMKFIGIWMVSMMLPSGLHAATWLKNLKVEYRNTPLAVGVMHPRFAWQMEVDDKSRGNLQSAYRISVIDETGKEVWNTGKVKSTESLGIQYAGESLLPATSGILQSGIRKTKSCRLLLLLKQPWCWVQTITILSRQPEKEHIWLGKVLNG